MTISVLQQKFEEAKATSDVGVHLQFVTELLADKSEEALEFHFSLLRDRENEKLYHLLRAKFRERGPSVVEFLAQHAKSESDLLLAGDCLQLLGGMRAAPALPLARDFLKHADADHRFRGVIVLGWVGEEADIECLESCLISDPSVKVRANSAAAIMQMSLRKPLWNETLIESLRRGFSVKQSPDVVENLILAAQEILGKKLGLTFSTSTGPVSGNRSKALEKTLKALGIDS